MKTKHSVVFFLLIISLLLSSCRFATGPILINKSAKTVTCKIDFGGGDVIQEILKSNEYVFLNRLHSTMSRLQVFEGVRNVYDIDESKLSGLYQTNDNNVMILVVEESSIKAITSKEFKALRNIKIRTPIPYPSD